MSKERLGRAVAHIVAETLTAHHGATLPAQTEYQQRAKTAQFESWEKELAPFVSKMLAPLKDIPDLPPHVRMMVEAADHPTHQVELALLLTTVVGFVIQSAKELSQPWVQALLNKMWARFPNQPLSPETAAIIALKGVWSGQAALDEAAHSGMDGDRFNALYAATGDPPGVMQLLEGYRRGFVDDGRLEHGIRQSRLKIEWLDVIKQLRYAPPSAAEAIAALVQGHVSDGQARKWAQESGLEPDAFDAMYQTAGMPPAAGEMLDLMRRGEATAGEVEQAIAESHIKNKYIPKLLAMARKLIPPRTVGTMVAHGILDQTTAVTYLQQYGYNAVDSAHVVTNAIHAKQLTTKDLAKGEVIEAYSMGLLDSAGASADLIKLGYGNGEDQLLLAIADHKKRLAYTNGVVSILRQRYISRHINKGQASSGLDALQIQADIRDLLLGLWDLELSASPKLLTLGEIGGMLKKGIMPQDEFDRRVLAMGYSEVDRGWLSKEYGGA